MSKERSARKKKAKRPLDAQPPTSKVRKKAPAPLAVPGQRLYEMPYGSSAPPLVNPGLGLDSLIARAGSNAGYDIDLTLLDAPDHRLIRSGVLLAHRVLDGRGEWYLAAPDWVPLLPKEVVESMSQGDLSEELADLIRPFRRRAPLSPVAALHCERREFALRNQVGPPLALLRDDKVTVRRGGLTIARYREVMLTPVGPGLNRAQADWLDQCLSEAGATVLTRFPRLVHRLGAPATGPTDFPEPEAYDPQAPFSAFLSSLIAARLRQILTADLRLRRGEPAAVELIKAAQTLARELDGLQGVLEEGWAADLIDELDWLAAVPVAAEETSEELSRQISNRLRGQRYLMLVDRLVVAARGVRLGDVATEPATAVVGGLATDQLAALSRAGSKLAVDGPARPWNDAWREFERVSLVDVVVAQLRPDEVAERQRRLARCRPLLAQVQRFDSSADELLARAEELPPGEAFALGREFERNREAAQTARSAFLISWAKCRRKLGV